MQTNLAEDSVRQNYADLMAKPVLSFEELVTAINVPFSTLEAVLDACPARMFLIGRRRYIKQADALAWIDELAERFPYHPRKNNRKGGAA